MAGGLPSGTDALRCALASCRQEVCCWGASAEVLHRFRGCLGKVSDRFVSALGQDLTERAGGDELPVGEEMDDGAHQLDELRVVTVYHCRGAHVRQLFTQSACTVSV